jgi:hypothetical protein
MLMIIMSTNSLTSRTPAMPLRRWSQCGTLLALILVGGISALHSPALAQSAACIYRSESYSDGAYICAQRSLMLRCGEDGGKLQWKIVTEKDVAGLCEGSESRPGNPARRETSGKCFYFRENRYCEP